MATRPSQAKQKHLFQVLVLLAVAREIQMGSDGGVGKVRFLAEEVRAELGKIHLRKHGFP